ncbi:MAG: putative MPP superfamily phosphohydrolase [Sulfitobacter sp.]
MTENSTKLQTAQSRGRQFRRFLLLALALHVPLFIYPVLRLGDWLAWPAWLTILVLMPVAGSQIISRYLLRGHGGRLSQLLRQLGDAILGISPVLLASLLLFELLVLASVLDVETAAWSVLALTLLAWVIGSLAAMIPMVKTFRLTSPRLKSPVRFMQITDVHIGSRSKGFLDKVISRINREKPDFLCITGDFIDASGVPESELVALKSVIGPIYYCIGNHEKYEDLDEILARLKNLGVHVLRDAAMMHRHDLQVIGIDDMEDPLQVEKQLRHIDLNPDAFKLLLYHRPRGLEAACEHNIELTLSGHTHNGQIFPFNLIVSRVFERIKGMYQLGEARQYVSQGTGTWGPVMRLGTLSEITLFEYEPEE